MQILFSIQIMSATDNVPVDLFSAHTEQALHLKGPVQRYIYIQINNTFRFVSDIIQTEFEQKKPTKKLAYNEKEAPVNVVKAHQHEFI